ncbi:MAG: NCS2 family permease [Bryobacteraceae bacterium]
MDALARYFDLDRLGTTWKRELLAGSTTFLTMAYIIFVNPSILRDAGIPFNGVLQATCIAAAVGSILMGAFARYPIALAPGMGLNAYFAYSVVKGMHVPWETALGAVFISGALMLLLTLLGIRKMIVSAIPPALYSAVAVGIGFFIAFIGFRNAGIIVSSPATTVALGNLREPSTLLALAGLLLIAALMAWGLRGAMVLGILATTALGFATGLIAWTPGVFTPADLSETAFHLDLAAAAKLGILEIVFVFLFVDVFDNVGTLVGVAKKAGLIAPDGDIPRINRILTADATATMVGASLGTSTVVSYIESASGVVAGGRSGVTAIVAGILFLIATVAAPLAGVIPAFATAPALILVGSMMISHVSEIKWDDVTVGVPAFLTILAIPLTFSIANGLAIGFSAYTLLKILHGEFREVGWLMYVLTSLFLLRFWYLGGG